MRLLVHRMLSAKRQSLAEGWGEIDLTFQSCPSLGDGSPAKSKSNSCKFSLRSLSPKSQLITKCSLAFSLVQGLCEKGTPLWEEAQAK